jgi:hypothetical protein
VRALFFMSHPGHLRNFESTLRELAARGQHVHVAFDREKEGLSGQDTLVAALDAEHESLTFGPAPALERGEEDALVARQLRALLDYLRYLDPRYETASRLRRRAAHEVPKPLFRVLEKVGNRRRVRDALAGLERSILPRKSATRFIDERRPDLVLVTPLLDFGSPQLDYLRAAKSLGIPTCLCVASWDNLTNKGLLHELPTAVTVWNEDQRREAVELHGVPADRVAVVGAQAYDHWFGRQPSRTAAELVELAQLPPGRPFVLYVCSSPFLAPKEGKWVARWARALRTSPHRSVREAGLLVRPHPLSPLDAPGLEGIEGLSVWPREGRNPVDDVTRADYFDSIAHAAAVVGLNTSAMIEAAIAGRPVLTVIRPEFPDGQVGTLHFRYLTAENGGPAVATRSLAEHTRNLADALAGKAEPATAFVVRFVRPHGLDEPATPRLVDALEQAAAAPVETPDRVPAAARAARPLLVLGGSIGLLLRGRRALRAAR